MPRHYRVMPVMPSSLFSIASDRSPLMPQSYFSIYLCNAATHFCYIFDGPAYSPQARDAAIFIFFRNMPVPLKEKARDDYRIMTISRHHIFFMRNERPDIATKSLSLDKISFIYRRDDLTPASQSQAHYFDFPRFHISGAEIRCRALFSPIMPIVSIRVLSIHIYARLLISSFDFDKIYTFIWPHF